MHLIIFHLCSQLECLIAATSIAAATTSVAATTTTTTTTSLVATLASLNILTTGTGDLDRLGATTVVLQLKQTKTQCQQVASATT
jgi:hypothetical protein